MSYLRIQCTDIMATADRVSTIIIASTSCHQRSLFSDSNQRSYVRKPAATEVNTLRTSSLVHVVGLYNVLALVVN